MDKKSNVVPFYRFPDPKDAKYDPRALADADAKLGSVFNNVALKQFERVLTRLTDESRLTGKVGFRSSAVTEQDPAFYAPEPIPDYCYRTRIYFTRWILEFQFFGANDPKIQDINHSRYSNAIRKNNPIADLIKVEADFVNLLWHVATRSSAINAQITGEADSFARFDFAQYENTHVNVLIRPVEEK